MKNSSSGIIFLAGIYGVGKSTLAAKLSKILHIPEYSASDLISKNNNESYGKNKFVHNADKNQSILVHAAKKILTKNKMFLLSGHFCIFNNDYSVNKLSTTFFDETNIKMILLLKADISKIMKNLEKRDNVSYNAEALTVLQNAEIEQAIKVSDKNKILLKTYKMKFSEEDILNVIDLINAE